MRGRPMRRSLARTANSGPQSSSPRYICVPPRRVPQTCGFSSRHTIPKTATSRHLSPGIPRTATESRQYPPLRSASSTTGSHAPNRTRSRQLWPQYRWHQRDTLLTSTFAQSAAFASVLTWLIAHAISVTHRCSARQSCGNQGPSVRSCSLNDAGSRASSAEQNNGPSLIDDRNARYAATSVASGILRRRTAVRTVDVVHGASPWACVKVTMPISGGLSTSNMAVDIGRMLHNTAGHQGLARHCFTNSANDSSVPVCAATRSAPTGRDATGAAGVKFSSSRARTVYRHRPDPFEGSPSAATAVDANADVVTCAARPVPGAAGAAQRRVARCTDPVKENGAPAITTRPLMPLRG